jgi:hypothetical protein
VAPETEVEPADDVATPEHDSPIDEIDYEEIFQSTQADYEAGRYCFNSEDYATDEESSAALLAFIQSIADEVEREAASHAPLDAAR